MKKEIQTKLRKLIERVIREERKKLKEDTDIELTLICTGEGSVQTMTGEARSAEILEGDKIQVVRENDHYYFGYPITKNKFMHSPGLSGKNIRNPYDVPKFEVAVNKDKIDVPSHSFWATFEIEE